jgi:uncharacterized membrane protein
MEENNKPFFKKYFLRIVCTALCLVFGLLIVTVGIFKTAFVIVLAALGFFIGRLLEDKDALRRLIDTYLGKS